MRQPGDEAARGDSRLGRDARVAPSTGVAHSEAPDWRPVACFIVVGRRHRDCAASRSCAARAPRRRSAARSRTASGRAERRCSRRGRTGRAPSRARSSDRPCADPAARSADDRPALPAIAQRRSGPVRARCTMVDRLPGSFDRQRAPCATVPSASVSAMGRPPASLHVPCAGCSSQAYRSDYPRRPAKTRHGARAAVCRATSPAVRRISRGGRAAPRKIRPCPTAPVARWADGTAGCADRPRGQPFGGQFRLRRPQSGTRTKPDGASEKALDLHGCLPPARASTCSRASVPPGATRRAALSQQARLYLDQRGDILRPLQAQDVRVPADGAGRRARRIEQHRVEQLARRPGRGVGLDELGLELAAARDCAPAGRAAGWTDRQPSPRRRPRRAAPSCRRAPRTDRRPTFQRRRRASAPARAAAASCTHHAPSA